MDLFPRRRMLAQFCHRISSQSFIWLGALVIAATGLLPTPVLAQEQDFPTWVQELRKEASHRGFKPAIIDAALKNVEFLPKVIELDRNVEVARAS